MKKTFVPGNKNCSSDVLCSGFILMWGVCALLAVSLIFISLFGLEAVRLENTERRAEKFYRELNENNSRYEQSKEVVKSEIF